jgi:transcription elongation factor GreA
VSTPTDEHDQGVWLTQEAHDRLKAELDQLVAGRPAMAAEINARREEADLKENGGYHAAKDEQGKQEARIRQLEEILRRAEVGETPPDDGVVEQGMKVTVRFVEFDEEETFLFGAREMEKEGLTVYSPQSALGAAINGRTKGETVSYSAPNGKNVSVEIIDAVPFTG